MQETQADSIEQITESAAKDKPQEPAQEKPRNGKAQRQTTEGLSQQASGSEGQQQQHQEGSTTGTSQRRSLQDMYGKHAPRQLWQLPGSRLSVGGHPVAGDGGNHQPIVLLPARQGSGRQQGLAVLPGSFAAQALALSKKASADTPAPDTGDLRWYCCACAARPCMLESDSALLVPQNVQSSPLQLSAGLSGRRSWKRSFCVVLHEQEIGLTQAKCNGLMSSDTMCTSISIRVRALPPPSLPPLPPAPQSNIKNLAQDASGTSFCTSSTCDCV